MNLEKINGAGAILRSGCECKGSGSGSCAGSCSNSTGSDAQNLKKSRAGQGQGS